jgi:lipopolysaccharide/colanic/teichoic acid biosynthesis glycosyltransferase
MQSSSARVEEVPLTVSSAPAETPSLRIVPSPEHSSEKVILDRKEELRTHHNYWILRRAQDIFFSLLALVVLCPLLLLIALVIYIDDPKGSPIFVQERCGRKGKVFRFYKFRTMCVDAEKKLDTLLKENEMDGPAFKMKDDPRITRVGHFLRRTSLDELPQLVNILKGDMSIVGPRPALPREIVQYDDYQRQRLYVTPGLTCYWQIQPNRNHLTFEEWMDLDIKYIQERSFWVDWKIIFKTVGAVLGNNGE